MQTTVIVRDRRDSGGMGNFASGMMVGSMMGGGWGYGWGWGGGMHHHHYGGWGHWGGGGYHG